MQIHNCWGPTLNGVRTQKVEHVLKADYDAKVAALTAAVADQAVRAEEAEARILELEADLKRARGIERG
jgi:hypothetical protein